jgi:hypothetical protein
MDTFDQILNWKLKAGSHPFPGPDGGTCINEAALVAAGFDYRQIGLAEEMPKCFSRPICDLAMWLNDEADDEERQRLLPFVTRLACADTPEIERKRKAYIRRHVGRSIYGPTLEQGLRALEGALAIGRRADPLPQEEVAARMDGVRSRLQVSTSPPNRSTLPKLIPCGT